jgi:hypothetical protein
VAYIRTILIATGLCMIALFVRSILYAVVPVVHGRATGIAVVRRGAIEFLIASIVLGWVSGTLWFAIRHLFTPSAR